MEHDVNVGDANIRPDANADGAYARLVPLDTVDKGPRP